MLGDIGLLRQRSLHYDVRFIAPSEVKLTDHEVSPVTKQNLAKLSRCPEENYLECGKRERVG